MRKIFLVIVNTLFASSSLATDTGATLDAFLKARESRDAEIAQSIWQWAEVGYQEHKSSGLLQEELRAAGFEVTAGIAGMPTAFVASYGKGGPVIALLAEFDALPGITQSALPRRDRLPGKLSGHACGHHLLGAGSVSAAIALRHWLKDNNQAGTIRLYGTPAEEGGDGKVYLTRDGAMAGVDVVLHWHPSSINAALPGNSLSNKKAKFRFSGISAHASAAPHRGRSALDGVEAMNYMVNLMREHVPSDARIHYVITSGGSAPNVVPDFAESYYYVRHKDPKIVAEIFDRLVEASEGAARGTGTRVEHEVIGGVHSLLPNDVLAQAMHTSLSEVGGFEYDESQQVFAEELYTSLGNPRLALGSQSEVQDMRYEEGGVGSTDVSDMSWNIPTTGLRTATWIPGTPAHSWQAIAAGGMSIGYKGMYQASRTLARMAVRLYQDPELLARARAEFEERRGPDYRYVPIVGDRAPPLDYRRGVPGGGDD